MYLIENIEDINEQLLIKYGREEEAGGKAKFRVVFSDDQFEKRITRWNDFGAELLFPEVRELPKYRQYIKGKFILERLVPVVGETDLVDRVSYEPLHVFVDKNDNYLPPRFDMCCYRIDCCLTMAAIMARDGTKDPDLNAENRIKKLQEMEERLFGNETDAGDALAHGYGIVNPAEKKHFSESETTVASDATKES
jgi:hypothetical protein